VAEKRILQQHHSTEAGFVSHIPIDDNSSAILLTANVATRGAIHADHHSPEGQSAAAKAVSKMM